MINRDVGVALSGSGFLLPGFCGAYAALSEMKYNIVELAGTSGGSIVSSLIACGFPYDKIFMLMENVNFSLFMSYKFWIFGWRNGLSSGDYLYQWLFNQTKGMTFADAKIPIKMVATNLTEGKSFIFSKETTPDVPLALGARTSSSLPVLYEAIYFDTNTKKRVSKMGKGVIELQDGGMVDNLAVNRLTSPQKIGLKIDHKMIPLTKSSTYLDKFGRIVTLSIDANEKLSIKESPDTTIIKIPSLGISSLDDDMSDEVKYNLYRSGYTSVISALSGS